MKKPAPRKVSSKRKKTASKSPHDHWNVTEAELTDGLNDDLRDAWKKLRAFGAKLGPQRIYASALSIMFSKKVCYFFVRPRKTFIEVWIFLPHRIEGLRFMQGPAKKVKYCNMFKLVHADQIESPLTDWIREAYEFAPEVKDDV